MRSLVEVAQEQRAVEQMAAPLRPEPRGVRHYVPGRVHLYATSAGYVCHKCSRVGGVDELVLRDNVTGEVVRCPTCSPRLLW